MTNSNLDELVDLDQLISQLERLEVERKRAEAEVEQVEKKVRSFLEQVEVDFCIVQDRLIRVVSSNLPLLSGYSREELINTSFAHYVHPAELQKLATYYLQRLAGGNVPIVYETIIKHKDGSDIPVRIKAGIVTYKGRLADIIIVEKSEKRS